MIVVGFMTLLTGSFIGFIVSKIARVELPTECKDWNKYYVMEISLFITGCLIHLLCEVSGVNNWYCKNG